MFDLLCALTGATPAEGLVYAKAFVLGVGVVVVVVFIVETRFRP